MTEAVHSRLELRKAETAINAMANSADLETFEEHWKEFLRRLERTWNKAEGQFYCDEKWREWQGRFAKLRRNDPLLRYLRHARNADEHTVAPITQRQESQLSMMAGPKGHAHIRSIRIDQHGLLVIDGDGPLKLSFHPEQMHLLPVENRGTIFPVPTRHLDKSINPTDVLSIARAALAFYTNFLNEVEAFFGTK